jgi:hypothetical protein
MKLHKRFLMVSVMFLFIALSAIASAGDFDWIKDLNIQAQLDPSGFKVRLATRFNIGDAQINALISNVKEPADAYMVLRLGEMSSKPTNYVIEQYKSGKDKGWGVLAKSLGIKPGSQEFKALKRGDDLSSVRAKNKDQGQGKSKARSKGKD